MASSIFDPLGFLCAVFLHPKLLLQQLTREKLDWDQEIDEEAAKTWTRLVFNTEITGGNQDPALRFYWPWNGNEHRTALLLRCITVCILI